MNRKWSRNSLSVQRIGLAPHRTGLALFRVCRLRFFTPGNFLRSEFCDASNQFHENRLRKRETDCTFVDLLRCKVVLECCDKYIASRIEREVLSPSGEKKHTVIIKFVGGHLVRDYFFGGWHCLADCGTHSFKYTPNSLRLGGNIFVYGFKVRFDHWRGTVALQISNCAQFKPNCYLCATPPFVSAGYFCC